MFGEYCGPVKCPDDRPVQSDSGTCYSCDYKDRIYGVETKECLKCPNRRNMDGRCMIKCPDHRPLQDNWGECFSCNDPDVVRTEDCNKCKNRKAFGEYCGFVKCPDNKPIQDKKGRCYACDNKSPFYIDDMIDGCNKCPNRYIDGNFCRFCNGIVSDDGKSCIEK